MSISESSSLAFSKSARAYFQIFLGLQGFGLEGICHFAVVSTVKTDVVNVTTW